MRLPCDALFQQRNSGVKVGLSDTWIPASSLHANPPGRARLSCFVRRWGARMIELPEAVTIARQMDENLKGKRIRDAERGNSPHKFAFYTRTAEEYKMILKDKRVGEARAHGNALLVFLEPDHVLVLGGGGERILWHPHESSLPQKHQLLLRFVDDSFLTVTVSGWGNVMLMLPSEFASHPHVGEARISPISDAFTFEHLCGMFNALREDDPTSIKYFIVSKPGIWGVGNGYLQDILFRAGIHPRRKAVELGESDHRNLHAAIVATLNQAVTLGGRDSERDLFNRPGSYTSVLGYKRVGKPCPTCGKAIEKIRFLGGACYLCPQCQM